MQGSKAVFLEDWARGRGLAYLRFDYSGHGESGGAFEDGCVGDWLADALAVFDAATQGPQILVGSSMGGWISLLLAKARPERVAGLVGVAAAPDFTENGFWARFSPDQRETVMRDGKIALPSIYGDDYVLTRRLFEDGRRNLALESPLTLPFPVRLLLGTADESVPVAWNTRLLAHMDCPDARLTLIKGADHRLSLPHELALIAATIESLLPG